MTASTNPGIFRSCFLDMQDSSIEDCDVAVLSIPYEGTVSYGKGTAKGPMAILEAGPHLETFDQELEVDLAEVLCLSTLPPIVPEKGERPEAFLPRVRSSCMGLGLDPPFPLSFGGEHAITASLLAGIRDDLSDVTVVQIDAHADLREEYNGSHHNHACAMRRVLDAGVKRLVAIGIRSCTAEEFAFARDDERIDSFYAHELREAESWNALLEELRAIEGPVYLTLDADGLDVTLCPGTGTPQPGGLSWERTLDVLRALIYEGRSTLFGSDIVEVAPQPHSQVNEVVAAKLALKILGYRFAPRADGRG